MMKLSGQNVVNKRIYARHASWITMAILLSCLSSCQEDAPLFVKRSSEHSGIDFRNVVVEDDVNHVLNFTNFYTGGGVGVADFNRDGLQDIFFGANMESSRLYLNQGDFRFQDVTSAAKVETDRWITGVSIVDVNTDGWPDIYLSVSGHGIDKSRKNMLFVNQGFSHPASENRTISFVESAEAYGLADDAQNTHASFFDYDHDGDLDMFTIINPTDYQLYNVNNIRAKKINGEAKSTDKLYRNNGDLTYTDVSSEAGILAEGYSLGMSVSDVNQDGWPDVYVTNDFLTNDILYINQQDGTFSDQASTLMQHTSFASMGIDIADINNDGYSDIFVLDMFPEDHYRDKMIMSADNYDRFEYMIKAGYQAQYSRNTLQLSRGGNSFSEVGQLSGIHQTDWSWSALFSDFDLDGHKDIYITNGFKRDMGSLDYINYANANPFGNPEAKRQEQIDKIAEQPATSIPNYIYRNIGNLQFENMAAEWGLDEPTVSHGAAYADLDNDGDLDLIVSNVSQEALIYENQAETLADLHYLVVELRAEDETPKNGAKVYLYQDGQMQYAEHQIYRGYLSTVDERLFFGTGGYAVIDSVKVVWPDGAAQIVKDVPTDQFITMAHADADRSIDYTETPKSTASFEASSLDIEYKHVEDVQVDFYQQSLLPHQHSLPGPHISVADINDDGKEDFFIGGAAGHAAQLFYQQADGTFTQEDFGFHAEREDVASLFFDADSDGDLDLYVVSGSVVSAGPTDIYQDRLYIQEADGFHHAQTALPEMNISGGCIGAADYDQDGDLDLFIGGRVSPGEYPTLPRSYLLENSKGRFTDVTPEPLQYIGMVSDATWADLNEDTYADLLIVGEFMPITMIYNHDGVLSEPEIIQKSSGWWNDIASGDFDQDGDLDFMVANAGLNMHLKASPTEPITLYANDFDQNGSIDPIMTHYVDGSEYPLASRDKLVRQIPAIKNRFQDYHSYASATFDDLFRGPEKEGMMSLKAELFATSYLENQGGGTFKLSSLPVSLQLSSIQDILVTDIDHDELLDVILVGNDYGPDVSLGRSDAFQGAVMWGQGDGNFDIQTGDVTGMRAAGDARSVIDLELADEERVYFVGNNKDAVEIYKQIKADKTGLLTYD